MDFFQGSAPPNFISFCLANQSEDELQASANTVPNLPATLTQVASHSSSSSDPVLPPVPSPPPFPPLVSSISRVQAEDVALLYSPDSNTDVTSYADEVVQRLEEAQASLIAETSSAVGTTPTLFLFNELEKTIQPCPSRGQVLRHSMPRQLSRQPTCHTLRLLTV